MCDGYDVRISGQDVGRGTFSQRCAVFNLSVSYIFQPLHLCRHAMLVDQKTEQTIVPLNDNLNCEGRLELANSKDYLGIFGYGVELWSFRFVERTGGSRSAYKRPE